jgi:hypothetical protein
MLFELFAPQRLKGMAAAVQGIELGRTSPFTAQIAPLNPGCFHPGIMFYIIAQFCLSYLFLWICFYDFIFY